MQEFQQLDEEHRTDTANLIREFASLSPERRAEVATMLSELVMEDAGCASELAAMMAKCVRGDIECCAYAANLIKEFIALAPERWPEVANMLTEFAKEDAERVSEASGGITAKMSIPLVEEFHGEVLKEESVAEETLAVELRDRIFAYLANHPNGTKLVEMEEEFGIARIQVAGVVRALIDDNKVEKRNLLYFAI